MTTDCNVRFMTSNAIPSITNISVSSADAVYPASNILDQRRSRLWKPTGAFEITALNDSIHINDGVSNKLASITLGSYATGDLLAAEIQTRLNAVSTNWVCTYDDTGGTYKFTINRTSGAAVLRLSVTGNSAWDTLGYTGSIDRSSSPFVADEQRNHTSEYIQIDLGSWPGIDFIAAIGSISAPFLSPSATMTAKASNTNVWTSPAYSVSIPIDDFGAFKFLDATQYYRYWRIEIVDRQNPAGPGAVAVGYLYLGSYDTVTSTNIARGFSRETIDASDITQSDIGVKYAYVKPQFDSFSSMSMDNVSDVDRKTILDTYKYLGSHTPFFISIDPQLNFSSTISDYTRYVYFSKQPTFTHIIRNYYSIGLAFDEAI